MSTKATEKPAARLPSYAVMISSAIAALHARGGSSRQAIFKYVCDNYQVDPPKAALFIRKALSKGLKDGLFKTARETGKGAGCFKLVKKEKKIAAKRPAAAARKSSKEVKPVAKKSAKLVKPGAKKSAKLVKPAAKKSAKLIKPVTKKSSKKAKPVAKKSKLVIPGAKKSTAKVKPAGEKA